MRAASKSGMACRWAEKTLARKAEGIAPAGREAARLHSHLADCAACRAFRDRLAADAAALRAMAGPEGDASSGRLAAAALARWESEAVGPRRAPASRPWLVGGLAAGAAAAVVAGGYVVSGGIGGGRSATPRVVSVPVGPQNAAPPSTRPVRLAHALTQPTLGMVVPPPPRAAAERKPAVAVPPSPRRITGLSGYAPRVPTPVRPVAVAPRTPTDDLAYLNGGGADRTVAYAERWGRYPHSEAERLQRDIDRTLRVGDDFVSVPFPRVAALPTADPAAAGALARYKQERAVVDARLQRRVTLAEKGVALSDLCEKLSAETGIPFSAARNVADDKVTIFCKDRPLRDLMRAITKHFNFAWERDGAEPEYRYRLFQPLRAQLLEEEMRGHDRNEALVALDAEMARYRSLLGVSPDEARALAETATGEDARRYRNLAGAGWGAIQLYFGLSPEQLAGLRDGKAVRASSAAGAENALPPEITSGVLRALDPMIRIRVDASGKPVGLTMSQDASKQPGVAPSALGSGSASVNLEVKSTELGRFELMGGSGFFTDSAHGRGGSGASTSLNIATGVSPSARDPKNAEANRALANDPALRARATLPPPSSVPATPRDGAAEAAAVTTADLLEAVHRATGRDVLGDYYTRLIPPFLLHSHGKETAFELLCRVSDVTGLRWGRDDEWLTFRTIGFFNERPKEVPARLLERWKRARTENGGVLPLRSLCEIARLSDVQLDARGMAEGAAKLYGLTQWEKVREATVRPSWRFLASLPPGQLGAALDARTGGITFDTLGPEAQERFARLTLGDNFRLTSGAEPLSGATLLVEYPIRARQGDAIPATPPGAPGADPAAAATAEPAVDARFTYRYRTGQVGGRPYRAIRILSTDGNSHMTSEPVPMPGDPPRAPLPPPPAPPTN